ncbi:MAG TPA: hypothetical protein VEL28_13125, partial [Candidatus Binatia bacterium]|nr:hypothetical protein [Candidatus Binatia bacterium]
MIRLIELFQRPWALHEPYLLKAYEVIARHDAGIRLNAEQIEAATASQQARAVGAEDLTPAADTAVIQIRGVIAQHAEMVSNISGPRGTSVEGIRRQINAAVNAAGIERIVLDVSSPGGSADGIDELAEDIRAAGQIKPVIAYTDSRM